MQGTGSDNPHAIYARNTTHTRFIGISELTSDFL